jgi:hypothetical protein
VIRTLRQHVARADEIMSCLGVRTLIPQKGLPAPIRIDASDRQREYALSILLPMQKCDESGYLAIYLQASREASYSIWERIPEMRRRKVGWEIRRMKRMLRDGGIGVE